MIGFVGKYYLFAGALEAGETVLVLIALLTSAVSMFYYLRVVVLMYMSTEERTLKFYRSNLVFIAVAICLFVTVNYGLFPGHLIQSVKRAALF